MSTDINRFSKNIDELLKKEKYFEAEESCKKFLEENKGNLNIYNILTWIQLLAYDSTEHARITNDKALSISPNDPEALSHLARIYRIEKNFNDAKKTVESALDIDPNCAVAWAVKGTISADGNGDYTEAFKFFEKATSLNPTDYHVWFWYAWRLWDAGYHAKAIELFKKSDELHPDDANILFTLSDVEKLAGKHNESIKYAQRCLEINPINLQAKFNLGFSYGKVGDYDKAIATLSSIKDHLNHYGLKEFAYCLYDNERYTESLEIFRALHADHPDDAGITNWIGICYFKLKDYEKTLSYCKKTLLIDPDYSDSYYIYFEALRTLKGNEEANKYLIDNQLPILKSRLVRAPNVGSNWQWLDSRPASRKEANKFLLACCVDGQQPALRAWDQVRIFAEETLGDPDLLWDKILETHSELDWKTRECKNIYKIHPFDSWHNRVWDVAYRIVHELDGDARRIWRKGDPEKPLGVEEEYESDVILDRLDYFMFGSPKYSGHQIPRMVIGALLDSEQALGPVDPKADTHVIRVVGRVVYGIEDLKDYVKDQKVAENIAIYTARLISPENPWYVDQQLFAPGALDKICVHSTPKCDNCGYKYFCFYKLGLKKDLPVLPEHLLSLRDYQKGIGIISS